MTTNENGATGAKPSKRNAFVTWLIPTVIFLLIFPLGNFLGQTAFRSAPSFASTTSILIAFFFTAAMIRELNTVTPTPLHAWHFLIPFYNLYWIAVVVPAQVAVAKQKAGKPPPRSAIVYLFLFLYAFAADMNELAE